MSELSEWCPELLVSEPLNLDFPILNRPGEAPLERLPAEILGKQLLHIKATFLS